MARLAAGVKKRADGKLEKRFTVNGERFSVYGSTNKELTEKEQELREKLREGKLEKVVKLPDGKKVTLYGHSRAELQEQEMKIEMGGIISFDDLTMDEYFQQWIERKRQEIKPSTIYKYLEQYRASIEKCFGQTKIKDITRAHIVKWKFEMDTVKKLSPRTTNGHLMFLRNILNTAVDDEIIDKNPGHRIKLSRISEKATEKHHRALTKEEERAFFEEAEGTFYYELLALMHKTGLRIGEAGALLWSDIDYEKGVIHVTKTLIQTENGSTEVGDPKTGAGKRDIPLDIDDSLISILESQRRKQKIVSIDQNQNFVFMSVRDTRICNSRVNAAIKLICNSLEKRTGIRIEHFTAHALRDTFATRKIEAGMNPKMLMYLMGHSSFRMTMDLYAQALPDAVKEECNRIKKVV